MNHTQRAALLAAEEAFRLYSDHHAMKGDETKARANMALAGQMSTALAEPEQAACGPAMTREEIMGMALEAPLGTTRHI